MARNAISNVDDDSSGNTEKHEIYTYNDQINRPLRYQADSEGAFRMPICFQYAQEFFSWVDNQGHTPDHTLRQKKYYKRDFEGKEFKTPLELHSYILAKGKDINNIIKSVRGYLNFCEQSDKIPIEVITKYRAVLKLKKTRTDYTVPSDEEIIKGYASVKNNLVLELVFLVQATSGIRYIECLEFLKSYEPSKFNIYSNHVSYNVSSLRHTKNINNIYLPLFVYEKLQKIAPDYYGLKMKLKRGGCSFSWKYLRKWHYNFMIYNNVPESVADFIQGRANRSVSSNHYLARSQQAGFWYEKIVERLDKLLNNRR